MRPPHIFVQRIHRTEKSFKIRSSKMCHSFQICKKRTIRHSLVVAFADVQKYRAQIKLLEKLRYKNVTANYRLSVFIFEVSNYIDQPFKLFLCSGHPNKVNLKTNAILCVHIINIKYFFATGLIGSVDYIF
jgi:hypothetical protein